MLLKVHSGNPEQNCSFSFFHTKAFCPSDQYYQFLLIFYRSRLFFPPQPSVFLSSWQSFTTTLLCHRSSTLPQLCKLLTFRTVMFCRLYRRISDQLNNELNMTFCVFVSVCCGLTPAGK